MILDLERSGRRLISTIKCINHVIFYCLSMGPEGRGLGAAAWILWLRDEYGSLEKVSSGGRVLRNASAMTAEREALRMGIEHLTVLFPKEVSSFDFQVENSGRTVQYKFNAQSLRLFGLHSDVNDAHRAGENRLQNKQTVPFWLLDAASEMTRLTDFRGDVALNKSGLGPVLCSSATHRDLKFGHSNVPSFLSAQPVLMGFFAVSYKHWLMGIFSYTACFFRFRICRLMRKSSMLQKSRLFNAPSTTLQLHVP